MGIDAAAACRTYSYTPDTDTRIGAAQFTELTRVYTLYKYINRI